MFASGYVNTARVLYIIKWVWHYHMLSFLVVSNILNYVLNWINYTDCSNKYCKWVWCCHMRRSLIVSNAELMSTNWWPLMGVACTWWWAPDACGSLTVSSQLDNTVCFYFPLVLQTIQGFCWYMQSFSTDLIYVYYVYICLAIWQPDSSLHSHDDHPLRWSKRQSPTSVFLKTTPIWTIKPNK